MPSLFNRLAIEVVPPLAFIAAWFYTKNPYFLLMLISIMAFYNIQRVIRQYKNIVKLKSISVKTIGEESNENPT